MILERLLPGPEARLLPVEKLHAPTVALLAIMSFTMIVIAAAGLVLANAASLVASGAEHRFVIQLPAAASDQLPRAVAAARAADGVRNVYPVSEAEMRETLEQWLGDAAGSADLPVPALLRVELAAGADASVLAAAVRSAVPEAAVSSENAQLEPLLSSISALQWLAIALVALITAATAAAIVLAARGALDTHRPTVEIMHGIGATDRQVTRLFERKIAIDAIAGALAGTAGALLVLLVVGGAIAAAADGFGSAVPLGRLDLLLLGAIPVAAVLLAVAVAHWTLVRALRTSL